MSTTHTMVAVAYRLTMEASHRDAVNAWLSVTPALPMGETNPPRSWSAHNLFPIRAHAGLWRTFRGPDFYGLDDAETIADARAWLAEHLPELEAFVAKIEARMEEIQS